MTPSMAALYGVAHRTMAPGRPWVGWALVLGALVLLGLVPTFVEPYSLSSLTLALIYLVAAVHLNVALGFSGEFVLHFPVVLGVGAYGTAVSSAVFKWAAIPSALVGIVLGTLVSIVLSLPGLKVRGFYLGVIGLFAVFTFPNFISLLREWTGGDDGLAGIRTPELFGTPVDGRFWYWIMAGIFTASVAWTYSLSRSAWGLRVRAMRDAKYAGTSAGLNQTRTRLTVYLVSSVPVAMAGSVYAFERQFVVPDSFGIELALLLLAGVLIGSKGTVAGPLVGTGLLLVFHLWVGEFSLWKPIIYGSALLLGSILVPNGLVSLIDQLLAVVKMRRVGGQQADVPAAPEEAEQPASPDKEHLAFLNDRELPVGSDPLLELRQVGKSFFGTSVLSGVELSLAPGTVTGLVGPNGSGKSTVLNIIAGVLAPDEGQVFLAGRELRGVPQHKLAQLGIGRTFQVPQLIEECTARENVELGLLQAQRLGFTAEILRTPRARRQARERRQDSTTIVESLGLPASMAQLRADQMPLGTKRVLEIGRAIALRPQLLLLDEPTAGLNPIERRTVGEFVRKLREAGITVLVVEHNVSFVLEFCDDVILLDQGRIVSRGSTTSSLAPELDAYLRHGVPSETKLEASDAPGR